MSEPMRDKLEALAATQRALLQKIQMLEQQEAEEEGAGGRLCRAGTAIHSTAELCHSPFRPAPQSTTTGARR